VCRADSSFWPESPPHPIVSSTSIGSAAISTIACLTSAIARNGSTPAGHRGPRSRVRSTRRTLWRLLRAICDYRRQGGTNGPLFIGKNTHALLKPRSRFSPQTPPLDVRWPSGHRQVARNCDESRPASRSEIDDLHAMVVIEIASARAVDQNGEVSRELVLPSVFLHVGRP
jgi:hypothetical protein